MKLDDLMIRAYMEGFSGANVYCDADKRDEVVTYIDEKCNQIGEFIHIVEEADYGVKVYLPMENAFGTDDFDSKSILKQFEKMLSELKIEKPFVKYRAYFACRFDDESNDIVNCEICNYEICSDDLEEGNEPYDFVGFALKFSTAPGGSMWNDLLEIFEEIEAEFEDIERVAKCLKTYVDAGLLDDMAYGELLSTISSYDDDLCIPLAESLL